jgi:hypothetical protein
VQTSGNGAWSKHRDCVTESTVIGHTASIANGQGYAIIF